MLYAHQDFFTAILHTALTKSVQEELRRLDMLNKFFFLARGDQAFSCPVRRGSPTRVLDLVTGTGIWAIQVAAE